MSAASTFALALHADGPAQDRAEQMRLYGQFVGAWEGTLSYLDRDGKQRQTSAEVHFDWTLEGRAVQDVWIVPGASERTEAGMYGSTTRIYDPRDDSWQIVWVDPVSGDYKRMTGRAVGEDIVQEVQDNGRLTQWIFTDITGDAFRWLSQSSSDGGATWMRTGEYQLRRRGAVNLSAHSRPERSSDFDFWIGSWQVNDPGTGALKGHSEIAPILDHRALRERWFGADGVNGESLNIYDASRRVWHQTWVDNTSQLLTLEGALRDGAMVLDGRDASGAKHRIRFTQPSGGEVLQEIDVSRDDGETWSSLFIGLYTPADAAWTE